MQEAAPGDTKGSGRRWKGLQNTRRSRTAFGAHQLHVPPTGGWLKGGPRLSPRGRQQQAPCAAAAVLFASHQAPGVSPLSPGSPLFPLCPVLFHTLHDSCRRKRNRARAEGQSGPEQGAPSCPFPRSTAGTGARRQHPSLPLLPSPRASRRSPRRGTARPSRGWLPGRWCTPVAWRSSLCSIYAKPQSPTRSQQCPARGGTCKPQNP